MPLRNQQPEAITTHGFVECTGLLPEALCVRLADLSMDKAAGISNSPCARAEPESGPEPILSLSLSLSQSLSLTQTQTQTQALTLTLKLSLSLSLSLTLRLRP